MMLTLRACGTSISQVCFSGSKRGRVCAIDYLKKEGMSVTFSLSSTVTSPKDMPPYISDAGSSNHPSMSLLNLQPASSAPLLGDLSDTDLTKSRTAKC